MRHFTLPQRHNLERVRRTLIIRATQTTDAFWERDEWACRSSPTSATNVQVEFDAPIRGAYAIVPTYETRHPLQANPMFQHSIWVETPGTTTCYFSESRRLATIEISRAELWCPEAGRQCEYTMVPIWISAQVEVDGHPLEVTEEGNIHNGTVQILRLRPH